MPRAQSPFAETGGASSFKARIEDHSNGITDLPGIDHMGNLTPFQNQVLDAANRYEAQKQEERREEARGNAGSGRTENSRAGSTQQNKGDMGQEETVRYVNEEMNPDHEVHDD